MILFGSLTETEEALVQIDRLDDIPKHLFDVINATTEPVVLDWITIAMKNISILANVQHVILTNNIVDQFLNLILCRHQDPDVIEHLLEALHGLCSNGKFWNI